MSSFNSIIDYLSIRLPDKIPISDFANTIYASWKGRINYGIYVIKWNWEFPFEGNLLEPRLNQVKIGIKKLNERRKTKMFNL